MMFNVHTDAQNHLQGYIVPNGFSTPARIRVTGNSQRLYEGGCHEVVNDLIRIGRHGTGLTSFVLDEMLIPGLAEIKDLTILDGDTGMLIFRRNRPDHDLQKRVFRLETTLATTSPYADTLMPRFAYGLRDVHLYGQETVSQLFNLNHYPSMYFEGRIHIRAHQRYLTDQFLSLVSVADPFTALAMKIDCLGHLDQHVINQLEEREYAAFLPLAGLFDGVAINRPDAVRRRLKQAPKDIMAALESPLVGLLTGNTPGQGGSRSDLSAALDVLSAFDIVLLAENAPRGQAAFAAALGLPPDLVPRTEIPIRVQALADTLRDLPVLEAALENDLIAYHCVVQADLATS
ncbi:hypothetical protein [Parasedimentitalea maritima]|uniref:Uncharacterized protein n=1 Tax=Parasedimentitalea maritima TaxID=2578117 RepID=A0A6A4RIP7_9RHOB|nr:hypothetical protein [Zongyanglinia marina]KAE9629301.1 hypothetical protein GP644_12855 [Zongyanglinia marina]